MKNLIELSEERKKEVIELIINYFDKERDEKIGFFAADMVLDFFIYKIGPVIYNQALSDAKIWFEKKIEFLESDFSLLIKE